MENIHYSRRLLSEVAVAPPPPAAGISHGSTDPPLGHKVNTFDANVIMVLAVLVCALICSFVLNFIIKCAFRCSTLILVDPSLLNHTNNNVPSSTKLGNRGIKKKALKTFPIVTYTSELKHPGIGSDCVICLSEFEIGEKIKVLPKCNHDFHVKCIDKWLNSHSSCPTCRNCLIETCQKIVPISSAVPAQEVIIRIEPLQREDVTPNNQH
ncbi:hypothetical protein HAX54_005517 [Datura stramonium]|uniref:RING-type E3 ubiquitin transferase n=1 Tax=Datura stramonium TaxID=4076 RepID=A0ABS8TAI5_DATST|nr:hypothetical protein [Datura stramonium]